MPLWQFSSMIPSLVLAAVVLASGVSLVARAETPGVAEIRESEAEPQMLPAGLRSVSVHSLLDLDVVTADDKSLGGVYDIVADPTDSRLTFLVIERGGNILGLGKTRAAIPWHRVGIEEGVRQFRLDMTMEEVERLPDWEGARAEGGGIGAAPMSERQDVD